MATVKKSPSAKPDAAPKAVPASKKSSKSSATSAKPEAPASKPGPTTKAPVVKAPVVKAAAAKASVAKAPLPKEVPVVPTPQTASKHEAVKSPATKAPPAKKLATPPKPVPGSFTLPPVKGVTKDGISYTKDFDAKFLSAQKALLLSEREAIAGQATRLEDEANALIEEQEMGDVQFDDEGGEGDTMVVERERDLALSAQARQIIVDIDAALARLETGAYGYSTESGVPISRERLEAIPWAIVLVSEKVGGIGRR